MNRRADINDEDVSNMYINQGMSTQEIATELGTNKATITNRLTYNGISLRQWTPLLSKNELSHLYTKERLQIGEIAEKHNVHPRTISRLLNRYDIISRKGGASRMQDVDFSPSPELSYVIGVVLGDGCVSKYKNSHQIILSVKDKDFVEYFSSCMKKLLGRECKVSLDNRGMYIVRYTSQNIYSFIYPKEEVGKFIEIIDIFPAEFIAGFFDSEGTVYRQNGKKSWTISFSNTNTTFLNLVSRCLSKLDIAHNTYTHKKRVGRKTAYSLNVLSAGWLRFANTISLSIKRKQDKLNVIIEERT